MHSRKTVINRDTPDFLDFFALYIRADGNTGIGMGHVMRCLAVAEAAADRDNCAHAGHDCSAETTVGSSEKEADGHSYVLFGTVIVPLYPSPEV